MGLTPAADHKKNMLKMDTCDIGSGTSMKTDVFFWIINVVAKSGNAPFQHFQLPVNVHSSEAKFPLVFFSDK